MPDSYKKEAGGNNFMFELMGVESITVVPGGSDMGAAMSKIAQELAYSERTIKNLIQDVTRRFGLRNRSHAVAYALRRGLI